MNNVHESVHRFILLMHLESIPFWPTGFHFRIWLALYLYTFVAEQKCMGRAMPKQLCILLWQTIQNGRNKNARNVQEVKSIWNEMFMRIEPITLLIRKKQSIGSPCENMQRKRWVASNEFVSFVFVTPMPTRNATKFHFQFQIWPR